MTTLRSLPYAIVPEPGPLTGRAVRLRESAGGCPDGLLNPERFAARRMGDPLRRQRRHRRLRPLGPGRRLRAQPPGVNRAHPTIR
jgi:hypothetical protein